MATKADLEAFVSSVTCPDDFDDFWSSTLAGLAELPLEPAVTPDPLRSNGDVKVYQATYQGLLIVEKGAWSGE